MLNPLLHLGSELTSVIEGGRLRPGDPLLAASQQPLAGCPLLHKLPLESAPPSRTPLGLDRIAELKVAEVSRHSR